MLTQIATALLAFASRVKLEDDEPTRTVYATRVDGVGNTAWGPVCDNTCGYANDRDCDDGGLGSEYSVCAAGTDCNDCSGGRLPVCAQPFWVDTPFDKMDGWTRMEGGGQGPAGEQGTQGCSTNPQGYTYHYGAAQPCTSGHMWGNDVSRATAHQPPLLCDAASECMRTARSGREHLHCRRRVRQGGGDS